MHVDGWNIVARHGGVCLMGSHVIHRRRKGGGDRNGGGVGMRVKWRFLIEKNLLDGGGAS